LIVEEKGRKMWMISLISGLFTFFLGFIIRVFKMSYLIAGYNTASKEEKKKYDEEKVVKFVSSLIMISSAFFIIGCLLSLLISTMQETIFFGSVIFFTGCIIGGIIYFNISGYAKVKE
jgi:biotin transporter BioY